MRSLSGEEILGCTRNKLRIFVFNVISKLLIFYFFDTEFSNLKENDRKWNSQTGSQNFKIHLYESVKVDQSGWRRPVREILDSQFLFDFPAISVFSSRESKPSWSFDTWSIFLKIRCIYRHLSLTSFVSFFSHLTRISRQFTHEPGHGPFVKDILQWDMYNVTCTISYCVDLESRVTSNWNRYQIHQWSIKLSLWKLAKPIIKPLITDKSCLLLALNHCVSSHWIALKILQEENQF